MIPESVDFTRDGVVLRPDLPARIHRLRFRACWRGRWLAVEITPGRLHLAADEDGEEPIPVHVGETWHRLGPGRTLEVGIDGTRARRACP